MQHVVSVRLEVRWLWPTITKEMVEAAFLQYGTIVHVVIESPAWGPKTGDPLCERYGMRYEFAYVTYSDKASAVAAQREMQGFIFIGAGVPTEHPHPALAIRFAFASVWLDDDADSPEDYGEVFEKEHLEVRTAARTAAISRRALACPTH